MLRRLKFFVIGSLISIIFLSMGPDNRLKDTFYAYVDYFNPEKRVISQLIISDSILIFVDVFTSLSTKIAKSFVVISPSMIESECFFERK